MITQHIHAYHSIALHSFIHYICYVSFTHFMLIFTYPPSLPSSNIFISHLLPPLPVYRLYYYVSGCTLHVTPASTTQQVWSSDRSCPPCLRDSTPSSAARLGPLTGKKERRQIVVNSPYRLAMPIYSFK